MSDVHCKAASLGGLFHINPSLQCRPLAHHVMSLPRGNSVGPARILSAADICSERRDERRPPAFVKCNLRAWSVPMCQRFRGLMGSLGFSATRNHPLGTKQPQGQSDTKASAAKRHEIAEIIAVI
jgi:hypothetical protein